LLYEASIWLAVLMERRAPHAEPQAEAASLTEP
jgi:hypothetical protein